MQPFILPLLGIQEKDVNSQNDDKRRYRGDYSIASLS